MSVTAPSIRPLPVGNITDTSDLPTITRFTDTAGASSVTDISQSILFARSVLRLGGWFPPMKSTISCPPIRVAPMRKKTSCPCVSLVTQKPGIPDREGGSQSLGLSSTTSRQGRALIFRDFKAPVRLCDFGPYENISLDRFFKGREPGKQGLSTLFRLAPFAFLYSFWRHARVTLT